MIDYKALLKAAGIEPPPTHVVITRELLEEYGYPRLNKADSALFTSLFTSRIVIPEGWELVRIKEMQGKANDTDYLYLSYRDRNHRCFDATTITQKATDSFCWCNYEMYKRSFRWCYYQPLIEKIDL